MMQRQVFLKGEGGGADTFLFILFTFIIFAFTNYFTLCKIVLCIWKKKFFFCHHSSLKICLSKLFKNGPENIP